MSYPEDVKNIIDASLKTLGNHGFRDKATIEEKTALNPTPCLKSSMQKQAKAQNISKQSSRAFRLVFKNMAFSLKTIYY